MNGRSISEVLASFLATGAEYNLQNDHYAGVLFFRTENGGIGAMGPTGPSVPICENVSESPPSDFFNYHFEKWSESPYPRPIPEMIGRIREIESKVRGSFRVPYTNLINLINTLNDEEQNKARMIITQMVIEKGDLLMRFKKVNGVFEFRHPLLPKVYIVSNNSRTPISYINENDFYVCRKEMNTETSEVIFVNCIEPYGKIRIGLRYTSGGFDPTNMVDINNMVDIPKNKIMCINQTDIPEGAMPPIHLDCKMVYRALKAFARTEPLFIDFCTGDDFNSPVVIKNVIKDENDAVIKLVIGTMNLSYGMQRK